VAGSQNFTVVENDTWEFNVVWQDSTGTPINLTGYSARCQVRSGFDGPLLLNLAGSIPTPANGTIQFSGFASIQQGSYVYDVEVTLGSPTVTYRKTLLRGSLVVQPEVVQSAG
jgi:hypothetical protein